MTRITGHVAVGAAVFALALSGCGSCGGRSSSDTKSGSSPASSATPTAAEVDRVGSVVTDSRGHVLYRFGEDSARPPR
ncbi:hypothetical protein [Streptomyces sp. bgisy031]|uniref:hypothetical protein n=1 Tax=Streptomyces sp. bgisy031 TaxID=3413772 RepID=UPI003D71E8C8